MFLFKMFYQIEFLPQLVPQIVLLSSPLSSLGFLPQDSSQTLENVFEVFNFTFLFLQ